MNPENDHWHVEEWKQEKEKFQKQINEQTAELQEKNRELEIEASLERVRAKAMAMHSTKDIESATVVVFNELSRLGIAMERCGINLLNETPTVELWSTTLSEESKEIINIVTGYLDFRIHPLLQQALQDWREKKDYSTYKLVGDEVRKYYAKLAKQPGYKFPKAAHYPDQQILHSFNFKEGGIFAYTKNELSEGEINIFKRFTEVFAQTYTRFLDIQKAEKQAREAQIEAALERIRSRSMAMQSSDELSEVVGLMYNEVEKLGVSNWGCALMIFDDTNKNVQMWFSEHVNNQHVRPYDFDNLNHELVRKWWEFWESEDEILSIHLKDEENEEWTNYMFENTGMKNLPKETKEVIRSENEVYFGYAKMKQGLVSFINLEPFPEETFPILKRIARTFEQAYTRFLDVQRAEKLALETARQASLDRIRAQIASMRSAQDLQQITPIIWDELKTLGIPFIRCGVFIIDEENRISHTYLSTSKGEPIAAMHLPLDGISLVENIRKSWGNHEIYTLHWDKKDFSEWTQNLIDRGFIESKEKYEAGTAPTTLDLHFLPFKQGLLYIGYTEPLSKKRLDLGQSMADAFSVAYNRYEDFNKLEQAKQRIEEAFQELEAAKDQLVQQEKLASLGQLTAGIAHEIKNPLNFVNNFSELSIELVEEAREEVRQMTGDGGPAKKSLRQPTEGKNDKVVQGDDAELTNASSPNLILEILDDIEANLKKIHKHGSRADGIVKSMLQHSRGGDGKIEPTDLNALVKEYVNLAFHGMRAGKNPINVDIELNLDKDVGEVPLVAEDFSRVILNLCNNAFDAMRERLSAASDQPSSDTPSPEGIPAGEGGENDIVVQGDDSSNKYEPKLSIRTHKNDQAVTIEIQDNGPGIPQKIKDKILQPFFTTKKGTAGTGLGLSITNDIIKAHGGQIDIDSEVNKFTKISIHLNLH
jgi:signal transduction histidine kinase